MQWFIDIIKERIHSQLGYFDRGDPAAPDFVKTDFIRDNAWHTLDLSAIVPEGAVLVLFCVRAHSPYIEQGIRLRKHGNTNDVARSMLRTQLAHVSMHFDWSTACSPDRKIDYRISVDPWGLIYLTVKGWWLR